MIVVIAVCGILSILTIENLVHRNVEKHQHPIEAHSGRTDSSGGHNNRKTGGYHYHHGCSAHSHPNGKCKYNFKSCR